MAGRNIEVKILGDASSLEKALGRSTTQTDAFGKQLNTTQGHVHNFHLGLIAATSGLIGGAGLVEGLKSVIAVAEVTGASTAKLDQAIVNMHGSVKSLIPVVNDAEAAGRKLGFANVETSDSLAKLVTAFGPTKKAFDVLKVAQDEARFSGKSLADSTQLLILVQAGNTRAAKALNIVLPDLTKKQWEAKASADGITIAQEKGKVAYAELTKRISDQAEAFAKTPAGKIAAFHAQVSGLEQVIGTALLPTFEKYLTKITDWIGKMQQSGKLQRDINAVMRTASGIVKDLTPVVKDVAGGFQGFSKAVGGTKTAIELLSAALIAAKFKNGIANVASLATNVKGLPAKKSVQILVGVAFAAGAYKVLQKIYGGFGADYSGTQAAGDLNPVFKNGKWVDPNTGKPVQDQAYWNSQYKQVGGGTKPAQGQNAYGGGGGGTTLQQGIIGTAKSKLGQKYVWGGTSWDLGMDCSGFTQQVMAKNGITIPRTSQQQAAGGVGVPMNQLIPGDLVFSEGWPHPGHVAIYIGGGQVIEDPHTGASVRYTSVGNFQHARRYMKKAAATGGGGGGGGGGSPYGPAAPSANAGNPPATTAAKKVAAVTGANLIPAALRESLAKAVGTKGTADDLAALKNVRAELERLQKTASKKEQVPIAEELAKVNKQINAIDTATVKAKLAVATAAYKTHAKEAVAVLKALDTQWKIHLKTLQDAADAEKKKFDQVLSQDDTTILRGFDEKFAAVKTAFDRVTAAGVAALAAPTIAPTKIAATTIAGVAQTPEEKALADFLAGRTAASDAVAATQRQTDLGTAQNALTVLQSIGVGGLDASGNIVDQNAIDTAIGNVGAAQDAINQAALDSQQAGLQAASDASRVAADQATADAQKAADQATTDAQTAADQATVDAQKVADDKAAAAQQVYQDQRDAQWQSLSDINDDQRTALQISLDDWNTAIGDKKASWTEFVKWMKDNGYDTSGLVDPGATPAGDAVAAATAAGFGGSAVGQTLQTIHEAAIAGTITAAQAAFLTSGHKLEIPGFAAGGIVMRPTLAMIGESGPEAIIPLGRAGGGQVIHVHVAGSVVTEKQVFDLVQKYAVRDVRSGGAGVPG